MRKKIIITSFQQQRSYYCYLLLSAWIFIIGIRYYRSLNNHGSETAHKMFKPLTSEKSHPLESSPKNNWSLEGRLKKAYKSCNPTDLIATGSEGIIQDRYNLEGVIFIFRHGDRGPINHVRDLDSMSCSYEENENSTSMYKDYVSFLSSHLTSPNFNNLYQYQGQPNSHPYLIPTSLLCEISQLTLAGVIQHLKLGSILRTVYFDKLFGNLTQLQNNVFAYTTKYRRTFQSLNAFLYGFLKERFYKIPLYSADSMYFCFEDCACPATETYRRAFINENINRLKLHPAMVKLIEDIGNVVYTRSDSSLFKDPLYIKDALLPYICHNNPLPCSKKKCVYPDQVSQVFTYIEWDVRQLAKSIKRHKYSSLNAYGFLKNIVSHLLKIVSNENPKLVLYSAHDKTLQCLLTALGVTTSDAVLPSYASRVIFEVYSPKQSISSPMKKFFFRLVFNGKDVTHRIKFCTVDRLFRPQIGSRVFLCSFESLIRFLHDDYFAAFNAVNFKDACAVNRS